MSKFTHEDLPSVSSSIPAPSKVTDEMSPIQQDEIPSMQETLKMLDQLHYAPRTSTIAAILQYAREQEVIH